MTINPAELRKLAVAHLGDGPPYVKHLYEACCALRQAADEIESLRDKLQDHSEGKEENRRMALDECRLRIALESELEAARTVVEAVKACKPEFWGPVFDNAIVDSAEITYDEWQAIQAACEAYDKARSGRTT